MARKRRSQIAGQFNARLIEMMESPAYRVLSLSAHRVLDRISIEHAHHGGTQNGQLPVTYDHFVEYGIDRQAIAPAIRELQALGFIEITRRGRPSAGEFRWPNFFRVTWIFADPPPTHEWRRINTVEEAEQIAQAARRAKQKQKPRVGKPHCHGMGNPHCKDQKPRVVNPPYRPSGENHTTSISPVVGSNRDDSEARPPQGAVASSRPLAQSLSEIAEPALAAALERLGKASAA